MQRTSYNAEFVNLNKANANFNSCILTISVGQTIHEGKKFIATLKLINKYFKSCTIAVCDTLQRHSTAIITNSNQGIMYNAAKREGDQWIDRNKPICDEWLDIPYTIKRWDDWFRTEDYFFYRKKVDELYSNDREFVGIIDFIAQSFNKRMEKRGDKFDIKVANKHSKEYLLEECAAMCIWYEEGYDVDVYPYIRNKAIEYTFSQIKKDVYKKLLAPVGLKFNKVASFDASMFKFALEKIINILPGHVYWKDADGKFLGCNDMQAKSYGFNSPDSLVGKYDMDILKADIAEKIRENDEEIMRDKQTCTFEEETFIGKQRKWMLSQKAPILGVNDEVLGIVGMSIDISDKKELEKSLIRQTKSLEEALSEKTRFLNNLSHEMRIPLHVIMAISEELHNNIDYFSQEEVKSFLSTLLQNNKRLVELVTNLLDLAKSKQRKSSYRFEKKDIVTTIHETISEFRPVASIELKTDHDKLFANIDELKISQVMRNIVSNAMKYGDKDSIVVELKQLKAQDSVLIKVKNKGIGILEEEREKVFEPFFQSSKTRTLTGGTGLGLSICKEIVFAHKGSIWIDQDESDMTSVNFTIPCIEQ